MIVEKKVLVETSARHVHVSRGDLDILFGEGYQLTHKKDLSQPGQFACEERVAVIGPRGSFPGVSILGPERPSTQVELSLSDARAIGIFVPIRESGDTVDSPGCKIVGPNGEIEISEGVIVPKRHIHITPADAQAFGLADQQEVSVKVDSSERPLVFGGVIVRVRDDFALAMHIDTDEANAGAIPAGTKGEIIA